MMCWSVEFYTICLEYENDQDQRRLFFFSQGGRGNQVRWTECCSDEGTSGKSGETCIPGGGQPYDETHHQLPLQKQRG